MLKKIRFVDNLVDKFLLVILVLILLIGLYITYDTMYVYYNASADRVAAYKPGSGQESKIPLSSDYVAWVTLDDTDVDYPIMQGATNDKYLNMDPFGRYSLSGSIFLDSRNKRDFTDQHNVVYGHHMENGYMFGALDKFKDEAYFDKHSTGLLTVGDQAYPLQVFALLETDAKDSAIFEPGKSDSALALAKKSSKYYRDPSSEHVLALTTCIDGTRTTRTIVLCSMDEPKPAEKKQ